jgi:hypothetical protein
MMMNGGSPLSSARAKISSTVAYLCAAAIARTPCAFAPAASSSILTGATSFTGIPASYAIA